MASVSRGQEDLIDFVDTAGVGLHWVAADGTILWANPANYEPLGYEASEFIGRNISEFHADHQVIEGILVRLTRGERLSNYPGRLLCKDGSIRKVLISSSMRRNDRGKLLHTCCFIVDANAGGLSSLELEQEALTREIERLRLIASRERGLVNAILEQSPHGIIVSDASGTLILHNQATERIWGGSASTESIADWQRYRAFHADGRPYQGSDWPMAKALTNKQVTEAEEYRIQRFDGSYGFLLGRSAPLLGPQGQVEGAISIFVDVTEHKRQEEESRVSAERYFTTLKSIGDAVIVTDAQARLTHMNPVAEQLTGWRLEEACGKPLSHIFRVFNEQTRVPVESPVDKVIREGQILGFANHTVLIAKGGNEVAIDNSGAPIWGENKELAGVVLVFRDVTQKRREEARRQFLFEASAALASSLEYAETLRKLARLAVPRIADFCVVDMTDDNGELRRLEVAHVDPGKVEWVQKISERYPPNPALPLRPPRGDAHAESSTHSRDTTETAGGDGGRRRTPAPAQRAGVVFVDGGTGQVPGPRLGCHQLCFG